MIFSRIFHFFFYLKPFQNKTKIIVCDQKLINLHNFFGVVGDFSVFAKDVGALACDADAVAGGQDVEVVDERAAASLVILFVILKKLF
jgi:hypothetical protein